MIYSRAAKENELRGLAQLQRDTFRPHEAGVERYLSYVFDDPTYSLNQTRVLEKEGEIVSHLRIWKRRLQLRGEPVLAGGIGSFLTVPGRRRQGWGRLLLEETEKHLKSQGYRVAFLFSAIGTQFYNRLGWTGVPLPQWKVDLNGSEIQASTDHPNVRLLDARDLANVAALYRDEIDGMTGPEVRTEDYWLSGPSRHRELFPNWGIEVSGQLVGYLHLKRSEEVLMVVEAALSTEAVEPATDFVLGRLKKAGGRRLLIDLPFEHPLVRMLLSRLTGKGTVRMQLREDLMAKVLDPGLIKDQAATQEEGVRWLFHLVCPQNHDLRHSDLSQPNSWKLYPAYYWRSDAF